MKMRHVSVFRLKDEFRTEEVVSLLAAQLRAMPETEPAIIACEIGVKPAAIPSVSPDGHVRFYDLIQIITFASPEDCAAYPGCKGHQDFLAASSQYMDNVAAIDYPVDE